MGKPHIAIRIPPSLLEKLNSYVEQSGTSRTDVVVSAIATYLGCQEDISLHQRMVELEQRLTEVEARLNTI